MKAIQFEITTGRYLLGLALRNVIPGILWSGLSCTRAIDAPEPALPGEDWVKVKTHYGGICGTDMKTVHLDTSLYYSPISSETFIMGHENVGTIVEVGSQAGDWQVGDRVVIEPTLWCKPRGFEDGGMCEFCAKGEVNRCVRISEGNLSPSVMTGFCTETGGSWSPYFLAHTSQLYRVPENVSDENAVLVEPFACGLHAVLQVPPADDETVLIIGAGTIGLVTLAALRGIGSKARVIVTARYPFQAEAARKLGADEVVLAGRDTDTFAAIGELTGGQVKKPILGKRIMIGGPDLTYECVGTAATVDDALRMTRNGGRVVIAGAPGTIRDLDWTSMFFQELALSGAYIYHHAEQYQGQTRKTYDVVFELMASGKVDVGWMVTHRFDLADYKHAFKLMEQRGQHQAIKGVFEFE